MIIGWILDLVGSFLTFIDSLLPSVTVPSWFTTDNFGSSLASSVGALIAPLNAILPLDEFLTALHDGLVLLPIVLAYLAFEWIWKHTPLVGAFL